VHLQRRAARGNHGLPGAAAFPGMDGFSPCRGAWPFAQPQVRFCLARLFDPPPGGDVSVRVLEKEFELALVRHFQHLRQAEETHGFDSSADLF
jgi:hypothetical protein